MLEVAETLGVKYVVYMRHNIKNGHALIDHYPGVSVEAGTHDTELAFKNTLAIAESALANQKHQVKLFEVYDTIKTPGDYTNFKQHKDGFVPVLAGEVSYDFFGLMAKRVKSFN